MNATIPSIMIGIQSGAVTHHQDQSIKFVSFNTRKIRNNTVPNPNPLLDDFSITVIILLYIRYRNIV